MGKMAGHKAAGCSQEQGREVGMDATVKKELAAEATATAKGVQTYKERGDKKKRMKNNPWKTSLRYRGHKKPFVRLPGVREALSVRRNAVLRHEAAPHKPEVIEKIKFPDTGPTDKCKCTYDCFRDDCLNADTSYYCTAANCNREGNCLNSLYECKDLELTVCKGTGIGMKNRPATTRWSFSSRALEARKSTLMRVITRMLNHSCDAPCHFVELRNRENVAVVVVAKRTIEVGEETVDYVDPWFDCVCAAYCRG
ncbi:SET domain-containing protein [Phytophthora infestans]|uniref:SET domain-containing protein n=1 Tax=Phytophthora infestans TaxID=4787 RepID=A0A8S9U527_PHYIN|nr:SET domain-containing protein [Phytophthora infestans]